VKEEDRKGAQGNSAKQFDMANMLARSSALANREHSSIRKLFEKKRAPPLPERRRSSLTGGAVEPERKFYYYTGDD